MLISEKVPFPLFKNNVDSAPQTDTKTSNQPSLLISAADTPPTTFSVSKEVLYLPLKSRPAFVSSSN